jgi:Coenzyme PQQ synthesis protein D (PqqD)
VAASGTAYVVDANRVVHETIDGETILLDLESGAYYSLRGSGPEIWALLAAGATVSDVAAAMSERYPREAAEAAGAVHELADRLSADGLIEPGAPAHQDPSEPPVPPPSGAFAAPLLERYTDMEYFLTLDPVHQVDGTAGWPVPGPRDG